MEIEVPKDFDDVFNDLPKRIKCQKKLAKLLEKLEKRQKELCSKKIEYYLDMLDKNFRKFDLPLTSFGICRNCKNTFELLKKCLTLKVENEINNTKFHNSKQGSSKIQQNYLEWLELLLERIEEDRDIYDMMVVISELCSLELLSKWVFLRGYDLYNHLYYTIEDDIKNCKNMIEIFWGYDGNIHPLNGVTDETIALVEKYVKSIVDKYQL